MSCPKIAALVVIATLAGGCGSAATSTPTPSTMHSAAPTTTPASAAGASSSAATTAPPGAVAADTHIKVYGNCTTPSIEPAEIVLACADYGVLVEGLHWTSWTTASATAVGTLVYNDCTPSCAEGHHHDVPDTRVVLTVPVKGAGGQLVWSQVQEYPQPPGYKTGPYHGGPQPLPVRPV
jgi:hypothetical protein